MVKLLMRFYDVNSGSILVDGHDIRDYTRHDLRKMFGMVLQDTWLYNGPIMENIRYGRPDATDAEVIAAAQMAACGSLRPHPAGWLQHGLERRDLQHLARDKCNCSPSRARSWPTRRFSSWTKPPAQRGHAHRGLIQRAMDRLMKNRTSFVIAHRLSTIRNADLILVMDHGDIVEQGAHEELLAAQGFYHNLYMSQFATQGEVLEAVSV
jgi:ATP-binding cassette subfamily B multidrug efflux pump